MAQLNITLNQDEILQLLSKDRDAAFKSLLENSLNSILAAEATAQAGAERYERSEDRCASRNGTRDRTLTTRIGRITLHVPRLRDVPFRTMVFENYSRSEAALVLAMAEMVVNGVSTRKVSRVMETLCGTSFSKSAVSEVCKELDAEVEAFRNRPLEGRFPFVTVDATYFKVRENGRIISKAFMIAYGTNEHGIREILGFDAYSSETKDSWKDFLTDLKKRGLHGVLLITSDAHEGLRDGISRVFPDVPWQRCQFHFSKNIADKAPKKYQAAIRAELHDMFNSDSVKAARRKRNEIINSYKDVAEAAMACLDEGFEDAMTVMELPKHLRKYFRTSNQLERLNRELKRRSRVIGIFPNLTSLLRLMGAVLVERHETIQNMKAVFSSMTYAELLKSDLRQRLSTIAEAQVFQAA